MAGKSPMVAMMSTSATITAGGESTDPMEELERKNPSIMDATTTPTTRFRLASVRKGSSTVAYSSEGSADASILATGR